MSLPKARILLVEDEPFIREILSEFFKLAEFDVAEASCGQEAVAWLERGGVFDLLVTDVHMPGRFDGLAVAQHARVRYPELPVVFATGRPESLATLGPNDVCLAKPFSPMDALKVVQRLLAS